MRFISSLDQHPEVRKERFPEHLWPSSGDPREVADGWIFLEFANAAGLHYTDYPDPRRDEWQSEDTTCSQESAAEAPGEINRETPQDGD